MIRSVLLEVAFESLPLNSRAWPPSIMALSIAAVSRESSNLLPKESAAAARASLIVTLS